MPERIEDIILAEFHSLKEALEVDDDSRYQLFEGQLKTLSKTVVRQEAVLKTINAITETAGSNTEITRFIEEASQAIKNNLDFDQVDILLLDASGQQLQPIAGSPNNKDQSVQLNKLLQGYIEQDIKEQQPQLIQHSPDAIEAVAPLVSQEQVIGILSAKSTQSILFTPRTTDLLQTLANQIANAIKNNQLF